MRFRHIDADLDDAGGDQDLLSPRDEILQGLFFFLGFHLAME